MTKAQTQSPKFNHPPIVEKLMGVQFMPLEGWSAPHFGLFWQEIRNDFPTFSVQPPLLSSAREFSPEEFIRCWFFHNTDKKIIQVQRDRFLYNWQKPADYEEYPHYESIRPEFEKAWHKFTQFLADNEISDPVIEQYEITYINHFERGREWQSLSDL